MATKRRSRIRLVSIAWRSKELFEREGRAQVLSPADANALQIFAERTADRDPESITRDEAKLPELANLAARLSHELEQGSGAVLLRGLPIDERAFWALTLQLGTPVSQSTEGRRLFHVRDAGYQPGDLRYRGPMSNKRLSFHTDRCDVIAFLCIQPAAEGGETFVVSSLALRDELRRRAPAVVETLSLPYPYLRHTVDHGNQRPYCELPVFSERDGFFGAHFLRVLIDRAAKSPDAPSLTDEQRAALDTLEALAEDPTMHASFRMEPGDVLLLNNWITFHRRSEFVDSPEPALKRHLLRLWLSMDNSRPIDPRFVDHFGAVEAGVLRGGMRAVRK